MKRIRLLSLCLASILLCSCEMSAEGVVSALNSSSGGSAPAAPGDLTGRYSDGSLHLSWSDNSDDEYSFELRYRVDNSAWQPSVYLDADTSSADITPGLSGEEYELHLRAVNNYGESSWAKLSLYVLDRSAVSTRSAVVPATDTVVTHDLPDTLTPGAYLYQGRDDGNGIDLVIVAEGYTRDELSQFSEDAVRLIAQTFDYYPLNLHQSGWNVHLLALPSAASGADDDGDPDSGRHTLYGASYNCNGTARLICVDSTQVLATVANYIPQYQLVLVLVNSDQYGGAGYSGMVVTSRHPAAVNLIRHELGHSFAGLADESDQGGYGPPETDPGAANVSLTADPQHVKWSEWIEKDPQTGIYEGAMHYPHKVWRPVQSSVMSALGAPFYAVNAAAWVKAVWQNTRPVTGYSPENSQVSLRYGGQQAFALDCRYGSNTVSVSWWVNDIKVETETPFNYLFIAEQSGSYTIRAEIQDITGSLSSGDEQLTQQTVSWTVHVTE